MDQNPRPRIVAGRLRIAVLCTLLALVGGVAQEASGQPTAVASHSVAIVVPPFASMADAGIDVSQSADTLAIIAVSTNIDGLRVLRSIAPFGRTAPVAPVDNLLASAADGFLVPNELTRAPQMTFADGVIRAGSGHYVVQGAPRTTTVYVTVTE